ncbi:hypothetical protein GRI42_06045 [Erythrobacter gaetbuli]|uniref:Uncharacterized protein n=1 Tax=Qipengyuania gaetbuli TaxID=266952 RepID=A0A844XZ70_9SPHN|nr:hypothetical protein [Qipengyuania gaetbuli]MXO50866.1 hypothetical protein [Qipengyuania gaetbuli]
MGERGLKPRSPTFHARLAAVLLRRLLSKAGSKHGNIGGLVECERRR